MALLTLSDLRTSVKTQLRVTNVTVWDTWVDDQLNLTLRNVCKSWNWPFLRSEETLELIAEYTTGTVAITEATKAVTGTGTTFTKAMTGRKFKFYDHAEINKVARYIGATSLTLENNYYGDTLTAGDYTIYKDVYTCPIDWKEVLDIWQYNSPCHFYRIGLTELRQKYMDSEPVNADSYYYAIGTTRPLTRINVDTPKGSGTFTKDEYVTGASGGYGILRKADSYTAPTWVYIEILYGSFSDNEVITGDDSAFYCSVNESNGYTKGNVGGFLTIHLYPAPYQNMILGCDIKKKAIPMDADNDEPIIPEDYRGLLVNKVCSYLASILEKKTLIPVFEQRYTEEYAIMVSDLIPWSDRVTKIQTDLRRKEY